MTMYEKIQLKLVKVFNRPHNYSIFIQLKGGVFRLGSKYYKTWKYGKPKHVSKLLVCFIDVFPCVCSCIFTSIIKIYLYSIRLQWSQKGLLLQCSLCITWDQEQQGTHGHVETLCHDLIHHSPLFLY